METKKCYSTTEHGVSTLGGRYSTTEQRRPTLGTRYSTTEHRRPTLVIVMGTDSGYAQAESVPVTITHENAETIEPGWNISGLLGYYYWSYYSGKQDIDTDDWYRLIITEPCVLTIDAAIETYIPTNVPLNAGFSVLKEADMEHELGRINIDRDKEWTTLTIDAKEPDTYFIHVWRAVNIWADMGHGGYILYVDSSAASSIQAIGQGTDDNWIIRDLGGKQVA